MRDELLSQYPYRTISGAVSTIEPMAQRALSSRISNPFLLFEIVHVATTGTAARFPGANSRVDS